MAAGVCFMGMGGPSRLDEVRPYLYRIFSDRHILPYPAPLRIPLAALIARMSWRASAAKYDMIGGRSPHMAQTSRQVELLSEALRRRGVDIPVRAAMRYTRPGIEEQVESLKAAGIETLIGLPQYPQFSTTTTASCFAVLKTAAARHGMKVVPVLAYPDLPGLVVAWRTAILDALPGAPAGLDASCHVLFLAHSIPVRCLYARDPYPEHVRRTATAIAAALGDGIPWSLAYQSRTARGRWLEPDARDAVVRLVSGGVKRLIVAPVSFMTENLETYYDLDACLSRLAREIAPVEFVRVRVPHAAPELIASLADLVLDKVHDGHDGGA